MIAAAVILRRAPLPVRIDDSKRLTPAQRLSAYRVILRSAEIGVGIVPSDLIDLHNIRQATLQAMRRAVERLATAPDLVLVDGNDPPALPMACRAIVRGDQHSYAIACASIVAKVTRDALMTFYDRLFPGYAFHRHKGYGTSAHLAALERLGPSLMHRESFGPVAAELVEAR